MRNKSFNSRKELYIILNYIKINFINHRFLFLQNNDDKKSKKTTYVDLIKSILNILF